MTPAFQSTAVVGAGAVGSFFGALLARAGRRVVLIGRAPHVQAIERDGLRLEMAGGAEAVRLPASTSLDAARDADLVLVCVKSRDSDAVARELAPRLAPGALVLSLQNGVENAATLKLHLTQTVAPAVVYVATELPAPGVVRHHGRGELLIGPLAPEPGLAQRLDAVAQHFGSAGVPVGISDHVLDELWQKLAINCAYNAISALSQLPYGPMTELAPIRELQRDVVQEVVAVAQACGRHLELETTLAATTRLAATMPGQRSSTAQDLARGRATEIDDLNGFIVRRGEALGVPTPANRALHALVKLAEVSRDTQHQMSQKS